jgi:hypothetical protein
LTLWGLQEFLDLFAGALLFSGIVAAEVFCMTRSKFVLGSILCVTSFAGGALIAQGARNPNLRAAQDLINQAIDRISAAQKANEFDMGGHAAHAKDLLLQAKREIKLAAEAADHR